MTQDEPSFSGIKGPNSIEHCLGFLFAMVEGEQVQIAVIELTVLTRFWCANNGIMNIDFLANLADIWAAIVGTVEFLVLYIIPWFFGLWGLWKKRKNP